MDSTRIRSAKIGESQVVRLREKARLALGDLLASPFARSQKTAEPRYGIKRLEAAVRQREVSSRLSRRVVPKG